MKYFEIKDPYYALIKAENEDEAIDVYIETVSDFDDELKIEEVEEEYAWNALKEVEQNYRSIEDLEADFNTNESSLLLIDGSLI